ncbi:hypothetical protein ES707_18899 [subsurface metagenome]
MNLAGSPVERLPGPPVHTGVPAVIIIDRTANWNASECAHKRDRKQHPC